MRKLLCLTFCFAAGASFGAYQYIISTDPVLSADSSEPTYSESVSLNVRGAASQSLGTALETRYRTFDESNTSALNRMKPATVVVIR